MLQGHIITNTPINNIDENKHSFRDKLITDLKFAIGLVCDPVAGG